ncbi:alpha/beta hydrolase, partial [Myxococcota bacterium]|nr:alpha/beta hydrolase [Myxococcota bacterium]MCZ7619097.1 alpha/beta hydrolase [Myxococcota bacterium]
MTTKRISIRELELEYEEHGEGERALVLVHGFTGSRRDFAPRVPRLARLGRTVTVDLRGHGGSTRTGDAASYTLDQLAEDLLAFLEAADLTGCDLLGHSMGGMAVLRAALAARGRIGSLVLMDTSAGPPALPVEMFRLAKQVVATAGLEKLAELMRARAPEDPSRSEADRRLEAEWGPGYWTEWRLPNFRAMDPVAYGAFGEAIFSQTPLTARLSEIAVPTLVMVGEEDSGFLPAADELATAIPGARRITIPRAAHQPQLENPPAWLDAIAAHLARVRAVKKGAGLDSSTFPDGKS